MWLRLGSLGSPSLCMGALSAYMCIVLHFFTSGRTRRVHVGDGGTSPARDVVAALPHVVHVVTGSDGKPDEIDIN